MEKIVQMKEEKNIEILVRNFAFRNALFAANVTSINEFHTVAIQYQGVSLYVFPHVFLMETQNDVSFCRLMNQSHFRKSFVCHLSQPQNMEELIIGSMATKAHPCESTGTKNITDSYTVHPITMNNSNCNTNAFL